MSKEYLRSMQEMPKRELEMNEPEVIGNNKVLNVISEHDAEMHHTTGNTIQDKDGDAHLINTIHENRNSNHKGGVVNKHDTSASNTANSKSMGKDKLMGKELKSVHEKHNSSEMLKNEIKNSQNESDRYNQNKKEKSSISPESKGINAQLNNDGN